MMGISRTIYGKYGHMLNLNNFMKLSAMLCIIAYLFIWSIPIAMVIIDRMHVVWLFCRDFLARHIFKSRRVINGGGTAMFALLALGGDIGCSLGPTIGMVSCIVGNDLQAGLLCAIIFPIILLMGLTILQKQRRQQ